MRAFGFFSIAVAAASFFVPTVLAAAAPAPAPAPEPALVQVSARATPQDVVSILNNMNTNLQPHVNALSMLLHIHRCIKH